jgi:hypothetical protein
VGGCKRLKVVEGSHRPFQVFARDVPDKATRNERIHQAVRVHHYTLREVGDFLGLYFSTISVIAKRVGETKEHQE